MYSDPMGPSFAVHPVKGLIDIVNPRRVTYNDVSIIYLSRVLCLCVCVCVTICVGTLCYSFSFINQTDQGEETEGSEREG
jgi:hypothetical protein